MRHRRSEARRSRGGVERFAEHPEARFEAAPIGSGNEREQVPHFLTGSFHRAMQSLNAGQAGRRFQLPRDQLHELAVGFRAQFDEFQVFRPGIHGSRFLNT
jgi:hypothetical protein